MQFKANCQRQPIDRLEVEHIGTDEVYLAIGEERYHNPKGAVILSKEDALTLASTIINHYKVEHK